MGSGEAGGKGVVLLLLLVLEEEDNFLRCREEDEVSKSRLEEVPERRLLVSIRLFLDDEGDEDVRGRGIPFPKLLTRPPMRLLLGRFLGGNKGR